MSDLKTIRVRCRELCVASMTPAPELEAAAVKDRTFEATDYADAVRRYACAVGAALSCSAELDVDVQEIHPDGGQDQLLVYRRVRVLQTFMVLDVPEPELAGGPAHLALVRPTRKTEEAAR